TVLQEDDEITESGEGAELNTAQLTLLRSMPYSTNFRIEADCSERNAMTGSLEDYHLVYYMTLTPENGASYVDGPEALISYLKEASTNTALSIDENDLEPGRVNFTVTRKGELKDIELESTSGYETVDRKMVELISRTSGKWKPATNGQGEMVDQKLVLFFGKRGC
ncbi:MAG: hypothetical protein R3275_11825, partial [Saprospiraceae bacterium]|nr:hypothetical protein [Saprospiraceae bacterium]